MYYNNNKNFIIPWRPFPIIKTVKDKKNVLYNYLQPLQWYYTLNQEIIKAREWIPHIGSPN